MGELSSRVEAAIIDLCLLPMQTETSWKTKKAQAADLRKFSRSEVAPHTATDTLNTLAKRKLLKRRRSGELEVTDSGRRALIDYIGLGSTQISHPHIFPAAVLGHLADWLRLWFGDRLVDLVQASAAPFPMPRRSKGVLPVERVFGAWNTDERGWRVLVLMQEAADPAWWVGRPNDRLNAIFEANRALIHAGVVVSWKTGHLAAIDDRLVSDEVLAVRRAQVAQLGKSTGLALTAVPEFPLPPLDAVPWDSYEDEFTEKFVVPLLRRMGLHDVSVRHGPDEYGKDVVGWYLSPARQERWVAVQVKRQVSGGVKSGDIVALRQQIHEAFEIPVGHLKAAEQRAIAEVWVLIASPLTAKALGYVVARMDEPARRANVVFLDRPALEELHVRMLGST